MLQFCTFFKSDFIKLITKKNVIKLKKVGSNEALKYIRLLTHFYQNKKIIRFVKLISQCLPSSQQSLLWSDSETRSVKVDSHLKRLKVLLYSTFLSQADEIAVNCFSLERGAIFHSEKFFAI